jgi:hypothetical protein
VSATSPNQPASDNELNGVAADSSSDVLAVGEYGHGNTNSSDQTFAMEH